MAISRRRIIRKRRKIVPLAVEIARLAQGTPIVGYHDEDGYLVIPKEYDDYLKDRSGIIYHLIGRDVILVRFAVIVTSSDDHGCSVAVVV